MCKQRGYAESSAAAGQSGWRLGSHPIAEGLEVLTARQGPAASRERDLFAGHTERVAAVGQHPRAVRGPIHEEKLVAAQHDLAVPARDDRLVDADVVVGIAPDGELRPRWAELV